MIMRHTFLRLRNFRGPAWGVAVVLFYSSCNLDFGPRKEAAAHATQVLLDRVASAIQAYGADCNGLPKINRDLSFLLRSYDTMAWSGPYIEEIPVDAWGTAIQFRADANGECVVSAGPDRTFDTEDDLRRLFVDRGAIGVTH